MSDEPGRSFFDQIAEATCPPGTNWDQFKAAMRQAHTGGYRPGRAAPDISLSPADAAKAAGFGEGPERIEVSYETAGPADPFGADHAAAVALTEMLGDLQAAGMPLASAERIIGTMLAVQGLMKMEADRGDQG